MALTIEDLNRTAIVRDGSKEGTDVSNTIGSIRLWIEGKPPIKTEIRILIVDNSKYNSLSDTKIRDKDTTLINSKIANVFTHSKVSIENYTIRGTSRRSFNMDIVVPREVVDGYTK